jgi:hypothetical protein
VLLRSERKNNVNLIEPEAGIGLIQNRLDSREWWMIVSYSEHGGLIAQWIERTFYTEDKNKDFHALMTSGPYVGVIYMAKKEHLTLDELKAGLDKEFGCKIGNVDGQDVIIPDDTPMPVIYWLLDTFKGNT